MTEASTQLLIRMQGLLKTVTSHPYYTSIYYFQRDVKNKIEEIKQKENIK